MDIALETLKYTLENKRPILLVGAGFSMEAKNAKRKEYGTGCTLSKLLFDKICASSSSDFDDMPSEDNLKDVCDFIRDLGDDKVKERDKIITEQFTGCTPASYHQYLVSYPWEYIFSLNVDPLIETIFDNSKKPLVVWNGDKCGHRRDNTTTLVKLHGCVESNNHQYIFDSTEYIKFSISESCFLRELGHQLTENDIILLGTEFQEDDILTILSTYANAGYDMHPKYFFVTPKIKSEKLKRKLKNEGYYWIKQTTADFLEFLETIQTNTDMTEFMKEKGMIPIGTHMQKLFYESELYHGKESRYADFWGEWDVIYPNTANWEQQINHASNKVICAVIGNSYCGKTCVARRIAVDLCKEGYYCFEYSFSNSDRIDYMLNYVKTLTSNCKLLILCDDNAATYWEHIISFVNSIPTNVIKCVVIAVAKEEVYSKKRYVFTYDGLVDLLEFMVSEKITSQYSKNIVAKLDEHNSLSVFYKYFENNRRLMENECKKIGDIIDVLYFASNGRYFVDHIKESLVIRNEQEKKYLMALIELGDLNISLIPLPIFCSLLNGLHIQINLDEFKRDFCDWITCQNNHIKIRAHRVLKKCFLEELSENERIELLFKIVSDTVGQFSEGTYNEFTDLFQSALLFKKLMSTHFLSIEAIDNLYKRVEDLCKDYSYYWVQRGIAKQYQQSYEFAEAYLRKALSINPKSYQVKHALAKNDMTRGLEEIKAGASEDTFMNGYNDMQALLENPAYSRAFSYSAHTLISMQIHYSSIVKKKMEYDKCRILVEILCQNYLDELVLKIIQKYVAYLKPEYFDLSESLRKYSSECESPGVVDPLDDDIVLFVSDKKK